MRFSQMVIKMFWCDECQMESDEVMSHRGLCQHWRPSEGCICIWPGWILGGVGVWVCVCVCAGCGWWWMRTEQEKDEAWNRMRMKDREVLAGPGRGKETVRQRWRDWEWRKNEGQRETNPLWKLLMFAPLSCTVASRLNLHSLRQYQVSVSGKYSSSVVRPVKVNMSMKKTLEGQKLELKIFLVFHSRP